MLWQSEKLVLVDQLDLEFGAGTSLLPVNSQSLLTIAWLINNLIIVIGGWILESSNMAAGVWRLNWLACQRWLVISGHHSIDYFGIGILKTPKIPNSAVDLSSGPFWSALALDFRPFSMIFFPSKLDLGMAKARKSIRTRSEYGSHVVWSGGSMWQPHPVANVSGIFLCCKPSN